VFEAMLGAALSGEPDAGGVLAYNYLSGEPITGVDEGRPLVLRTPDSRLTLGNVVRAQVFASFATLSLGMQVLAREGVDLDVLVAHGGLFRTEGVAQRLLAAALDTPVAVGASAGEGGAWGIAVLASYVAHADECDLTEYLRTRIFAEDDHRVVQPDRSDVEGFQTFLRRFTEALPVERAAARST
jgi:sugar (pentulose or hexulose) kinase